MKLIIELSENDYKALKEDGVQNHLALADTIIANSIPYEEPTQGDLISREALKQACSEMVSGSNNSDFIPCPSWNNAMELIDNAPTVNDCPNCEYKLEADYIRSSSSYKELIDLRKFKEENTRPQGEWVRDGVGLFKCSICSRHICTDISNDKPYINFPFCHCGADMRKGGQDAAD